MTLFKGVIVVIVAFLLFAVYDKQAEANEMDSFNYDAANPGDQKKFLDCSSEADSDTFVEVALENSRRTMVQFRQLQENSRRLKAYRNDNSRFKKPLVDMATLNFVGQYEFLTTTPSQKAGLKDVPDAQEVTPSEEEGITNAIFVKCMTRRGYKFVSAGQ